MSCPYEEPEWEYEDYRPGGFFDQEKAKDERLPLPLYMEKTESDWYKMWKADCQLQREHRTTRKLYERRKRIIQVQKGRVRQVFNRLEETGLDLDDFISETFKKEV